MLAQVRHLSARHILVNFLPITCFILLMYRVDTLDYADDAKEKVCMENGNTDVLEIYKICSFVTKAYLRIILAFFLR